MVDLTNLRTLPYNIMDENTRTTIYFVCVAINIFIAGRYCNWNDKHNNIFLIMGISWGPAGTALFALSFFFRFIERRLGIKLY